MLKPPFLATGRTTLTIIRPTAGTYDDNGRYIEGSTSTFNIVANVQPGLKFNDTQFLPEGERGRLAVRVYTDTEIRARGVNIPQALPSQPGHDADRFWWDGNTYVVRWCHNYAMGILSHWKAIAVAEETT